MCNKIVKKLLLLAIALIIITPVGIAIARSVKQGYHVIGVAMYCGRFLEAPKLPAMSTLMNTFGDPLPCVRQRIQRGGLELVKIDLMDATCHRNRVCPSGTPKLTDWTELRKRASQVGTVARNNPQIEWWVSPWLEHDIKDASTVRKGCEVALQGCPTCKCMNTPFSGARPSEIPLELHGTKVRAFSVSGDGASMFDGDNIASDGNNFEHRVAGSDQSWAWFNEFNLRCTGEKTFTAPKRRTEKPTADLFKQAYYTMLPEPSIPKAPSYCKSVVRVDGRKGEILKPNAESYCNGQQKDQRGNKPLAILRKAGKRGQKMRILNTNGREVGCYSYYGTYEKAGLHRWYVGTCSNQTPVGLYNKLGGEWGFADLGSGKCLLVNAIRRMGVYR